MLGVELKKSLIESNGRPKSRVNREYLLRKEVAYELNTYLSFSPFRIFGDIMSEKERAKYNDAWLAQQNADENSRRELTDAEQPEVGAWGVRSIFNRLGAVALGDGSALDASEIRKSNNVPLIDTAGIRKEMRENSNCTIRDLVQASQAGTLGRAIYSYSDFMYCKHLGKIPNSYLVTLRRFPIPPDDYIGSAGIGNTRSRTDIASKNAQPIGTMVTWLNTPGNNMEDILKYSVKMPYEEKQAKWENGGIDADASDKPLNAAAAVFDKTYRGQMAGGYAGNAVGGYIDKFFPMASKIGDNSPPYKHLLGFQDSNKVYGPVDAVKKVYYRGDGGIDFDQSFSLTFDYELRSYNGINGKQALLDLLSNILNVTYTTGTFWGGGYTGGGAHQNNIFANLEIMKCKGGFTDFMDAFSNDISTVKSSISTSVKSQGGFLNALKNFFNDLGGMLAGDLLNRLGRPMKSAVNSLLSPAPTGLWHVTIGNPFHPIMSLGNMVITNTTISHYGPLGLDDFPTGIRVVVELTRGKPRDLRGIEMIYMNGNDRIYTGMGPKVFDMYTHSAEYKKQNGSPVNINSESWTGFASLFTDHKKLKTIKSTDINNAVPGNLKGTLKKYFGQDDAYSIYVAAAEQEYGAYEKKKENKSKAGLKSKGKTK